MRLNGSSTLKADQIPNFTRLTRWLAWLIYEDGGHAIEVQQVSFSCRTSPMHHIDSQARANISGTALACTHYSPACLNGTPIEAAMQEVLCLNAGLI